MCCTNIILLGVVVHPNQLLHPARMCLTTTTHRLYVGANTVISYLDNEVGLRDKEACVQFVNALIDDRQRFVQRKPLHVISVHYRQRECRTVPVRTIRHLEHKQKTIANSAFRYRATMYTARVGLKRTPSTLKSIARKYKHIVPNKVHDRLLITRSIEVWGGFIASGEQRGQYSTNTGETGAYSHLAHVQVSFLVTGATRAGNPRRSTRNI